MSLMHTGLSDDVYTQIQAFFRETPVLLIGSGFSCGYDLPSMNGLGSHLVMVVEEKLSSEQAKQIWVNSLDAISKNLEAGLNTIPNNVDCREEIIQVIREETAKLIIEKTHAAELAIINNPDPAKLAPARLLRKLFAGAPQNAESISVITTNYDTLIELFCDIADIPLDTGFFGFRRRRLKSQARSQTQYNRLVVTEKKGNRYDYRPLVSVRLYKPHGSITWQNTNDGPVEVVNTLSPHNIAIVVPGPSKYQEALVNTLFDTVRTDMNTSLHRASALFCIGFGFNDDHLQTVIQTRLDAHMPTLIITRDLTSNIQSILSRYPHVIAFCQSSLIEGGSEYHYANQVVHSPEPLWQLDAFLKTFIE